jgi:hypothetical protein
MGLLAAADSGVQGWCDRLRADLPRLLIQFQELFFQEDGDTTCPLVLNREFLSDNVIRVLRESLRRARDQQRPLVSTLDLLICLLTASSSIVAECFERIGLTVTRLTELALLAERNAARDVPSDTPSPESRP